MNAITTIRASSTPQAFLCPGSIRLGEIEINETNEQASLGTAAHEAFRPLAEIGSVDWDSLPAIAERYPGVELDELRILCAQATKLWAKVRDSYPDAASEMSLSSFLSSGVTLTGHVDLVSVRGTVARIADWKTGRKDRDYAHQLRAYAVLALLDDAQLTEATSGALWVRDGEVENYTVTRADTQAWLDDLHGRVINWDGVWHPGVHCKHCVRSHECPAVKAMVRRDVSMLLTQDLDRQAEALTAMAPAQIVALHRKAAIVSMYADRVHDAIKAHVTAHGPVVADGMKLELATESRRELNPEAAMPILRSAGLTDCEIAGCSKVAISKVEKVVASKAGRGHGAAAIRALSASLADAKAVNTNSFTKLVERRA